jgi:hypothetical protein
MSEITDLFVDVYAEMHNKDIDVAKFKIGEQVIYCPIQSTFPHLVGQKFIITGMALEDYDASGKPIIEYSMSGFPFLVWENELEKVLDSTFCSRCGAPKKTFKCDYCGI